nr:hypothetical protein [Tanacetum cinerariifolium]
VIQNGNSLKRTRRDHDRGVIILPPTTAEEHIAIQRESKVRTTLLQFIPDDHSSEQVILENLLSWVSLLSDKSSEVNTNEFASSDSSVKSSEPKPNDSTSCASTSSVSTSEHEAKIKSNVGTPIKEPIIVQDLPSFSCNKSDKNVHTSRTSCKKNGYFNKKAGHFRKNASSVYKLCFICGSGTHLIKDYDFYEKQMANKTVGIGVGHVYNRNKVNYQNQFVPHAVLLRTGKVNIPPVRPQPVPTGKPKVTPVPTGKPQVSTPVPTGRPNRPFPVPTGRGYSPSVMFGWWSRIYGKLLLSPQQVVLGNHIEKVFTGEDCQLGVLGLVGIMWEGAGAHGECEGMNLVLVRYGELPGDGG